MKTIIDILIILITLYMWYISIKETIYLEKDISKWIYIEWSKLHSLSHISILLWPILLSIWLLFVGQLLLLLIFNMYFLLIVEPHITWEK